MGRSTYADHDRQQQSSQPRRSPRTQQVTSPQSVWNAVLMQPLDARADSQQPLVVSVAGPVMLDQATVELGVEPRGGGRIAWQQAQWDSVDGMTGVAVASLGVDALRVRKGRYEVLAAVTVKGLRTVLQAGHLTLV